MTKPQAASLYNKYSLSTCDAKFWELYILAPYTSGRHPQWMVTIPSSNPYLFAGEKDQEHSKPLQSRFFILQDIVKVVGIAMSVGNK
jgi:hypothetical protein